MTELGVPTILLRPCRMTKREIISSNNFLPQDFPGKLTTYRAISALYIWRKSWSQVKPLAYADNVYIILEEIFEKSE